MKEPMIHSLFPMEFGIQLMILNFLSHSKTQLYQMLQRTYLYRVEFFKYFMH